MNITPFIEGGAPEFRVGTRYDDGGSGSVADVYCAYGWLHIETDAFSGHAMLRIEALPLLIEALQKLNQYRKSAA